jgi:hypothetical protein
MEQPQAVLALMPGSGPARFERVTFACHAKWYTMKYARIADRHVRNDRRAQNLNAMVLWGAD